MMDEYQDRLGKQPPKRIALPEHIFAFHAAATKDQNFVICHVPYSSTNESGIECHYQVI
jgi:hypothetical protein